MEHCKDVRRSHSVLSALNFNPWLLRPVDGDWELQFVIYQLFRLHKDFLNENHVRAVGVNLKNLFITESLWIHVPEENSKIFYCDGSSISSRSLSPASSGYPLSGAPSYDVISYLVGRSFKSVCNDWLFHRISNFHYILYLNYMVGRKWDDPNYYPIMPWVTDFSVKNGGFIDLSKTKFRQTKGDAALDSTFTLISSGSTPPHHIPSLLTDLTYYLYKARRLEKELLCKHVRKRWVPSEYPSSMKRMQEWSPEECIPDFYCDSTIFKSIHDDLPDIGYPAWCTDPEDFIGYHRSLLESDYVSANLHRWIDLTFGYKLSGLEAVAEKNVHLFLVDASGKVSHRSGIVQLFDSPHPPRFCSVSCERKEFSSKSPLALLDFTEKLANFFKDFGPIDESFEKHVRQVLESKWDFEDSKHLLTGIAVLMVEILLFRSASAEITAINETEDEEAGFQARYRLAVSLYKRFRDNFDKMSPNFRPFFDEVLFGSHISEDDARLDLHRLHPKAAIDVVLNEGLNFPDYFPSLYACLVEMHFQRHNNAQPIELVKTIMKFLASPIDLPYSIGPSLFKLFSDLFTWDDTKSLAIFCLLPNLGTYLGPENCCKFLLKPLKQVLHAMTKSRVVTPTQKQHALKFFHRDFQLKLVNLFGISAYLEAVVPFIVRGTIVFAEDIEPTTLSWAIDFVGPVHAARAVTPVIFNNLSICYDEIANSLTQSESPCQQCPFPSLHCVGDSKVDRFGSVLCLAACTYGELFITGHYVSCMAEIVRQAFSSQGSLSRETEASLLGVLYVLRQLVFIMPKELLTSQVQERLSRLLTQVITQITSPDVAFPRAPRSLHLTLGRYLDLVYAIGLRLGRLNTEQFLENLLRLTLIKLSVSFRASLPSTSDESDDSDVVLPEQRLPAESLQLAYSVCSRIVSKPFLDSMITSTNPPLPVFQPTGVDLCSTASRDRQLFSLSNSFGLAGSNRLSQDSAVASLTAAQPTFDEIDRSYQLWERKSRHLTNQWAALWAQRLAAPRDYSLKGLYLQSFMGTTTQTKGSVQHLVVSKANEQMAISVSSGPSRERAVAVWSLQSRNDLSTTCAPVLLYPEHKRRCIGLALLEAHRQVLSVDAGTLHLWDPAVGRPVSLLTCPAAVASLPNSAHVSAFSSPQWTCASPMDESGHLGLVSTGYGLVFIIDPRLPSAVASAIRAPPLPSGSTSILSANSDASMIAVASNSSYVSVLCPRTGRLIGASRAYDSDLAKMKFLNRTQLLTANHDRILSLSTVNDSTGQSSLPLMAESAIGDGATSALGLVGHFKATLSDNPVAIIPTNQPPLLIVATSDRLQYYTSGADPRSTCADFLFSRLDVLRGKAVTAATMIPSSGFILLGTETGNLHMIA